jgi:hypothetical protein
MDNTYSVISPTAVDAFALLSQRLLSDPLTEEIGKHVPRFLFKLDDPQGSQSVADASGNVTPAAIAHSKYGAGSLVFGTDITAADPVNGVFTGSGGGTVATVNNPGAGTNLLEPATYIDLSPSGITGPDFTVEWSRMIAFRYTGTAPTAGNWATIWSSIGKNAPHGGAPSKLVLFAGDDGKAKVTVGGQSGSLTIFAPTPSSGTVLDGNWHLVGLSYDHINHLISINLDGVVTGYTDISTVIPTNLASDSLGAWIDPNTAGGSAYNFKGDIAFAAEFTTGMGTTDVSNMYAAWKNSFTGDATDVRYGRILDWAGYSGARNIQTGQTRSMGAANVDGQDALSALQAVVDTEGGSHFVSTDGTVTFKSRAARYNALTPAYTFGERTDLGEFPYEEVELDYDSTHLGNIVTVTQASTSQVFTAQDAASQLAYFPRTLARTVNSSDPLECQAAAEYLLSRYKNPATRVSSLKLHPAAYPSLWPVCLGLELGTRVRIMRRPIGRPAITVDAFVEQIQWELDDTGEAFVTLQCSPVDLTPYGLFASWHTTFAAGTSVGATTITINAPKDNTNPLAAQIARGQQLVVSPAGTTSKETVTVASVSSTGSPWTTGTITLTSGLTHSHTSGATICEPLPTGITDPTTWDVPSTFDSHAFAY